MNWTIDEMMAEEPCLPKYTRKYVTDLWAGRESLTLLDIFALDIPSADKMWAAWRPGALTEGQETALLDKIVTRAVTNHALHCKIKAVETWAEKWLSGEDKTAEAAAEAAAAAWAIAACCGAAAAAEAAEAAWAIAAGCGAAAAAAFAAAAWAAEYGLQVIDALDILSEEATLC